MSNDPPDQSRRGETFRPNAGAPQPTRSPGGPVPVSSSSARADPNARSAPPPQGSGGAPLSPATQVGLQNLSEQIARTNQQAAQQAAQQPSAADTPNLMGPYGAGAVATLPRPEVDPAEPAKKRRELTSAERLRKMLYEASYPKEPAAWRDVRVPTPREIAEIVEENGETKEMLDVRMEHLRWLALTREQRLAEAGASPLNLTNYLMNGVMVQEVTVLTLNGVALRLRYRTVRDGDSRSARIVQAEYPEWEKAHVWERLLLAVSIDLWPKVFGQHDWPVPAMTNTPSSAVLPPELLRQRLEFLAHMPPYVVNQAYRHLEWFSERTNTFIANADMGNG
jgi:hypothetical protein